MTSPWILQTVSAITIFRQANMAIIIRNTVFFITCYLNPNIVSAPMMSSFHV